MNGKSYSQINPLGTRRMARDEKGTLRVLAPKAFRKHGFHYMDEIKPSEIYGFYFNGNVNHWAEIYNDGIPNEENANTVKDVFAFMGKSF